MSLRAVNAEFVNIFKWEIPINKWNEDKLGTKLNEI